MSLLQLCNQLERIKQRVERDDAVTAYQIERIRQNFRLDFPSLQKPPKFADRSSYPKNYPLARGPFVPADRENFLLTELQNGLSDELEKLAVQIENSNSILTYTDLWYKYIALLHGIEGEDRLMDTRYNQGNVSKSPNRLCRYTPLSVFLYSLMPLDPTRKWSRTEIWLFAQDLAKEIARPGRNWKKLASIWHSARSAIDHGQSFRIRPHRDKAIWFWTNAEKPPHNPGSPPTSSSALEVIRRLGLPSWETDAERQKKLGIVAVTIENHSLDTYRPTLLDLLSTSCYFFLPGPRKQKAGLTWPLTKCCSYNDAANKNGYEEWTAVTPIGGVSASIGNLKTMQPSFELVGLFFSKRHSRLFTPRVLP